MKTSYLYESGVFISISIFHVLAIYMLSTTILPQMSIQTIAFEVVDIETLIQGVNEAAPVQKTAVPTQKSPTIQKTQARQTPLTKAIQTDQILATQESLHDDLPIPSQKNTATSNNKSSIPESAHQTGNSEHGTAGSSHTQNDGGSQIGGSIGSDGGLTKSSISSGQIQSIARTYPETAKEQMIEGSVRLRVHVRANGRAQEIQVLNSPHPLLSNAAKLGARKASYIPAIKNGQAIASILEFNVVYQINKQTAPK